MRVSNNAVAKAPNTDILKVHVFSKSEKIAHAEMKQSIKFLHSLS